MPATRLILAEQEERERYAEKHAKFDQAMTAALHQIRIDECLRNRPPAAQYILAEYKWPYK